MHVVIGNLIGKTQQAVENDIPLIVNSSNINSQPTGPDAQKANET